MLAIYLSLMVMAVLVALAGPRGFLLGLGNVLLVTLWVLGKTLKVLLETLDVLEVIFHILSLFG